MHNETGHAGKELFTYGESEPESPTVDCSMVVAVYFVDETVNHECNHSWELIGPWPLAISLCNIHLFLYFYTISMTLLLL